MDAACMSLCYERPPSPWFAPADLALLLFMQHVLQMWLACRRKPNYHTFFCFVEFSDARCGPPSTYRLHSRPCMCSGVPPASLAGKHPSARAITAYTARTRAQGSEDGTGYGRPPGGGPQHPGELGKEQSHRRWRRRRGRKQQQTVSGKTSLRGVHPAAVPCLPGSRLPAARRVQPLCPAAVPGLRTFAGLPGGWLPAVWSGAPLPSGACAYAGDVKVRSLATHRLTSSMQWHSDLPPGGLLFDPSADYMVMTRALATSRHAAVASYANSAARKRSSEQKDPERVARTVMVEHLAAGYDEQVAPKLKMSNPFACESHMASNINKRLPSAGNWEHEMRTHVCFVQAIAQYFDAVGRVVAVRIDKTPDKSGTPRVWVEFETQAAAHDACELSGQVRIAFSEPVTCTLSAAVALAPL